MEECVFYSKVGTCRHGEKCSKLHYKPKYSNIVKVANMYTGEDLESFVVDLFTEASKFATIDEFLIAGNNSEHLKGTVYISFANEKGAELLVASWENRWYNEMPLYSSLSPIKDLWGACCRDPDTCSRGGECNYLHPIPISREVLEPLFGSQPQDERPRPRRDSPRNFRPRDSRDSRDFRDSRDSHDRDSRSRDQRAPPRYNSQDAQTASRY